MMSKTWSGPYWERKLLCFYSGECELSHDLKRGDREGRGIKWNKQTTKPPEMFRKEVKNQGRWPSTVLRALHVLQQQIFFFKFHHYSSNMNAFENSWASAQLHTLKVMSTLRKILWDSLVSEKCCSKKIFLKPKIFFFIPNETGEKFCHWLKVSQTSTLCARMANVPPIADKSGPKSLCHMLPPNNSFIEVS